MASAEPGYATRRRRTVCSAPRPTAQGGAMVDLPRLTPDTLRVRPALLRGTRPVRHGRRPGRAHEGAGARAGPPGLPHAPGLRGRSRSSRPGIARREPHPPPLVAVALGPLPRRGVPRGGGQARRLERAAARLRGLAVGAARPRRRAASPPSWPRSGTPPTPPASSPTGSGPKGLRDKAIILWNANNVMGFDRIDWGRLDFCSQITTVSRYMKHVMWDRGVNPLVIPNGIPGDRIRRADPATGRAPAGRLPRTRAALQDRPLQPRQALEHGRRRPGRGEAGGAATSPR